MESQKKQPCVLSFEFFPPKTEKGEKKLQDAYNRLAKLNPEFFSVTYGAGGSTRERTIETVFNTQKETGIETAPHISCIGLSEDAIRELILHYKDNDIKRLVALRGDLPSGMVDHGPFNYANELVAFIRKETGRHFHIEVAAYPEYHPQAESAFKDIENFKKKVDAGADSAITQYFYNLDAYTYFINECERQQINIPVIPGIMPITNYKQLARFSDSCGAEIPRWLRKRLEAYHDDLESIKKLGMEYITQLCQDLIDLGSPGIHFYTMNNAELIIEICDQLDFDK